MQVDLGDQKLGHILKEGIDGDIVLIGFPYDIGVKRDKLQYGQDNGPDCFRRFVPKLGPLLNPEYGIDISKIIMSDYGNIQIQDKQDQLEENLEKLTQKVQLVLKKSGLPIIIGGSRDSNFAGVSALLQQEGKKIGSFQVCPCFDVKPLYDFDKISSQSHSRKIINKFQQQLDANQLFIRNFAVDSDQISQNDMDFIKDQKNFLYTTNQVIRTHVKKNQEYLTKAGEFFKENLDKMTENVDQINLLISLESINSAFCPGVSNSVVNLGLQSEDIIEIMMIAGKNNKVVSVNISDYNPSIEDYRTGRLVTNMIYYFLMGYSQR